MSEFLRDYHLPSITVAIILGFQLTFYFFYLYLKVRKEKLELNKILLGYSFLYGFSMNGVLLRSIINNYVEAGAIRDIFYLISLIMLVSGGLCFLVLISNKAFEPIINPRITKIVILLIVIVSFLIIIINQPTIRNVINLSIILVITVHLTVFNLNLIKISTGDVKRRLIILAVGQILMFSYIIINITLNITQIINEPLLVGLIGGLIASQALVLFGVYQFPAFLEFEWKSNLIKMYVINHKDYSELYSYEFIDIPDKPRDNQSPVEKIFTRGLIGIDQIVSSITKTENKRIKKIKQEDIHIILDYGEEPIPLIYALIVYKEMNSTHYFLRTVSKKFDSFYKHILLDLEAIKGKEIQVFSTFNEKMIKLLE